MPAAPWRVKSVQMLPNWSLLVTFNDGVSGRVDLSRLVNSPDAGVFSALRDKAYFSMVYLDLGAVTWPNGGHLGPEEMHDAIEQTGIWVVD